LKEAVIATSYDLTSLTADTEYLIEVEAFDAAGNISARAYVKVKTLSGVAIDSPSAAMDIAVYPNPVVDYLHIHAEDGAIEAVIISDMAGRVVYRSGNAKLSIAVAGWENGVYLVTVKTDKGVKTHKVIKK
jgi:hypothetical protein